MNNQLPLYQPVPHPPPPRPAPSAEMQDVEAVKDSLALAHAVLVDAEERLQQLARRLARNAAGRRGGGRPGVA